MRKRFLAVIAEILAVLALVIPISFAVLAAPGDPGPGEPPDGMPALSIQFNVIPNLTYNGATVGYNISISNASTNPLIIPANCRNIVVSFYPPGATGQPVAVPTYTSAPFNLNGGDGPILLPTQSVTLALNPDITTAIGKATFSGTALVFPVETQISGSNNIPLVIINPNPGITITSPNGGENWALGRSHNITWVYGGNVSSWVKIELLKSGILVKTIAPFLPKGASGNGFYSWTIPATQAAGTDYRIKVTSTSNSNISDTSDTSFSIGGGLTLTITVAAGVNGTITPGTGTVVDGATPTYSITANAGYQIAEVKVDGGSVGALNSYTFAPVHANHTISATFSAITYTITVVAGANGTITPGSGTVTDGATPTYNITANPGYQIADVKVDGDSVGAVSSYAFAPVHANHTISATFAPPPDPAGNDGFSVAIFTGRLTTQYQTAIHTVFTQPPSTMSFVEYTVLIYNVDYVDYPFQYKCEKFYSNFIRGPNSAPQLTGGVSLMGDPDGSIFDSYPQIDGNDIQIYLGYGLAPNINGYYKIIAKWAIVP
jgi:hypothetical protein